MPKYISDRVRNLKVGIDTYTDDDTVLVSSGNVGIGTETATGTGDTVLHIKGSNSVNSASNYGSISLENPSDSGTYYAGSIDYYTLGQHTAQIKALKATGGPNGVGYIEHYVQNSSSNLENTFTIAPSFVNVGKSNGVSSAKFQVFNTSNGADADGINLGNMATPSGSNISLNFVDYQANPYFSLKGVYSGSPKTGDLAFFANNGSATQTEVMRCSAGGSLNFPDNNKVILGDSDDFQFYFDGSNSRIDSINSSLKVRSNFVEFQNGAGTGTVASFNGTFARLFYQGAVVLQTVSGGVSIVGTLTSDGLDLGDNDRLRLGDSQDLQIWHTGSNSVIQDNGTGNLYIQGSNSVRITDPSANEMAVFVDGGAVELYYDNAKKFETTSGGIQIYGTTVAATSAVISGPDEIVIDPATVGDNTGTVVIKGDLQIDGTTTTVNSTTVTIDDKNIVLASGAANAAAADGGGITLDGANATLTYASTGDKWVFNKVPYYNTNRILTTADEGSGNGLDADTLDGQEGSYYQPASTALTTSTTFGGDVSGTYNAIVVADDSHNHVISNVDGLQSALDNKLSLSGGQLTGNITFSGTQTVDGRDLSVDGAKLDNIEPNATADQTAGEILSALLTVDGTGSSLDADLLDGQQGSYYLNTATTFGGDVSGTYNAIVVADDSHNHAFDNLTGKTAGSGDYKTTGTFIGNTLTSTVTTGTAPLTVTSTTLVTNLNADLLDGQQGSFYQPASTALTTSTTFGGDVSGTYNAIVVADDSHNHVISNIDNLQTTLDDKLDTSTTFGGDVSGTYDAIVVANDSHTHDGRYFTETESDARYLGINDKAADSDLLDGQDSSYYLNTSTTFGGDVSGTYNAIVVANDSHTHDGRYFTETESDARYLGITAKAADSNLLDGLDSTQFLRSDANDSTSGQITITRANNTATGQIYLNGTSGNRIDWNTSGVAAPAFTTRSVGTKLVLYPAISASNVDYALGIEGSTLWYSVPTTSAVHRWYGGTTEMMKLTNSVLTVGGNTVWNAGNDGAGSGLDADLLDGQQGSYYLNTSTTFGGDVSGTFNAIVVANDSHTHDGRYFTETESDARYLGINDKAADSDLLDGQDGSYYAPINSPTFTGIPAAPTASAGTNTTQIATTAFVSTAVSNLIDSAPTALDTLNELAAALGDDPNFATTITNSLAGKLSLTGGQMTGNITFSGAQTVDGRDLSVDGTKLDGIEPNATADQTPAEILTAIKTVDGASSGLDADLLDGQQGSYYQPASTALTTSTTFGGDVSGTYNAIVVANDSHTHDGRYFTETESDARYLGITAKAADSNLLDGLDSTQFLRSDTADTASGVITFSSDINVADKIVHDGDTNTAIRFPAADTFTVETTGLERFRVSSTGNVGIGSSGPPSTLTINYSNATAYSSTFTPSGGYLPSVIDGLTVENTNNSISTPFSSLHFRAAGSSGQAAGKLILGNSTAGSGFFAFQLRDSAHTSEVREKVRITSAGNVGIGTNNPSGRLEVYNGDAYLSNNIYLSGGVGNTYKPVNVGVNDIFLNTRHLNAGYGVWVRSSNAGDRRIGIDGSLNDLLLYSNSTEKVRIKDSGNVGIGTSNPSTLLHLRGGAATATIDSSTNTAYVNFINTTTTGYFGLANNDLNLVLGGTERVRITSAGRVGIGTQSPTEILTVAGNASFLDQNNVERFSVKRITSPLIEYKISANNYFLTLESVGSSQGAILFNTGASSATERLRITSAGNVGIGTQSPAARLHVEGADLLVKNGTGVPYIVLAGRDTDGRSEIAFRNNTYTANNARFVGLDNQLALEVAGSERLRIISNGNIGIGTESPTEKLEVSGNIKLSSNGTGASASSYELLFYGTSSGSVQKNQAKIQSSPWSNNTNAGVLKFFTNSSTNVVTERMIIDGDGNVGIATSAPAYKLEVNGSFAATTKSFVIDHPTKEGKKLRYGSLEGPENGVYVRGKSTEFVIELPEYWTKLVDEDSITVNLTAIGKSQSLWVKDIKDNKIYIGSKCTTVKYFYTVFGERIDVEKLEVEY